MPLPQALAGQYRGSGGTDLGASPLCKALALVRTMAHNIVLAHGLFADGSACKHYQCRTRWPNIRR
jgi:hypothetical protein